MSKTRKKSFTIVCVVTDPSNRTKIAAEAQHGLIAQVLKDIIFSVRLPQGGTSAEEFGPRSPDPKRMEGIVETAMA